MCYYIIIYYVYHYFIFILILFWFFTTCQIQFILIISDARKIIRRSIIFVVVFVPEIRISGIFFGNLLTVLGAPLRGPWILVSYF